MEVEKESESEIINTLISTQANKTNNIYSNLSATEEINISFETPKPERNVIICPELYKSKDIFRCHLCKELLTTSLNPKNDNINIDYVPNFLRFLLSIVQNVPKNPERKKTNYIFAKIAKKSYVKSI